MQKNCLKKWGTGVLCLWGFFATAYADPKNTSTSQSNTKCAEIITKLGAGFDSEDSEHFYKAIELAEDSVRARDIFWARDLAALDGLVLATLVKRDEPADAPELPLNSLREEIRKTQIENIAQYKQKLSSGTLEERLLALNSFYLLALRNEGADTALDAISLALNSVHPEVQRFAFKGLWTLWIGFDALAQRSSEEPWADRRDRIENLFVDGLNARLKVLDFDLLNDRLFSEKGREQMKQILRTRENLMDQNQAEAFLNATVDFLGISKQPRPITRTTFETAYAFGTFGEHTTIIDFRVTPKEKEASVPAFSPELIQLLQSTDAIVNEQARLYVTYLMAWTRDQTDPKYKALIQIYRQKLNLLEQQSALRLKQEELSEENRRFEVFGEKRDDLVGLVVDASNPEKQDAVIERVKSFLALYEMPFANLKSRDDERGVTLDVVAERAGLLGLSIKLKKEFLVRACSHD